MLRLGDGGAGEAGEAGGDEEVNSKLYLTCSLFPVPCSLFPVPCSLFPVPCSLFLTNDE
ncbi:MAG: hypothetical protein RIB93_17535 [Coleofasciculus sp. D1-CHI-01]|uniref:hypothetical protein n=1 Tax=Coleofasciculus sp. D1-CHI-01 TaxID=3068482 RepID=UPI0032FC24F8